MIEFLLYLRTMRPLFPLLISIVLCLGACHTDKNADKKDKDSALSGINSGGQRPDSMAAAIDSPIYDRDSMALSKLKTSFSDTTIPYYGLWVNQHYISEIREGKPLHESADTETNCIVIPRRTLQITRFIFGFHDGGASLTLVKKASRFFTYALYDGRCVDTLEPMADGRLKIGHDIYTRIGEEDTASSDLGVLEELLFAGQYLQPDGRKVIFTKDRQIEGLDGFTLYDPVIDYADFITKVDHIRMGRDKKNMDDYGFRFVGDTIMIYTIDCLKRETDDCVLDTLGRRAYTLVKAK